MGTSQPDCSVAEGFFLSEGKKFVLSLLYTEELPCSDNRELNCRQCSLIPSSRTFLVLIKGKGNAVFLGIST